MIVCESGLHAPADLADMARYGARAFLIGEALMRADDVPRPRAPCFRPRPTPGGMMP